jgi:hypothetical protein
MYTSKTHTDVRAAGAPGPPPCDTFSLGEHPIVVVEGFPGVNEAVLELSTNGNVIGEQSFRLNSGQIEETRRAEPSAYQDFKGRLVNRDTFQVYVNAGFQVDLGALPAAAYDLTLRTNHVSAAVAHFTVVMPAELEKERQAIELERKRLEEAVSSIKKLGVEIEHEKAALDQSNASLVDAFNTKVGRYNELAEKAKTDATAFNARVQAYNLQFAGYSLKGL